MWLINISYIYIHIYIAYLTSHENTWLVSNSFICTYSRWTNKSNHAGAYQMKPQAPNFNVAQSSIYIVSSALGFVHRPQARSPKATLKFGDVGATTIQQGIDFIVHLRYFLLNYKTSHKYTWF